MAEEDAHAAEAEEPKEGFSKKQYDGRRGPSPGTQNNRGKGKRGQGGGGKYSRGGQGTYAAPADPRKRVVRQAVGRGRW